jgi:hypothetical protein
MRWQWRRRTAAARAPISRCRRIPVGEGSKWRSESTLRTCRRAIPWRARSAAAGACRGTGRGRDAAPAGAVKRLAERLDGRRLLEVEATGKNLVLHFEDGVVLP